MKTNENETANTKALLLVGSVCMALAAGCGLEGGLLDEGFPPGTRTVPVSVSLRVPARAQAAVAGCAELSSVKLVIRKIDLRGYTDCGGASPTPSGTETGSETPTPTETPSPTATATPAFTAVTENDGCEVEPEIGPFLVDLSGADVNGTLQQGILDAQLPIAHYDRVRYNLHELEDGATSSDPAMQSMIDARLSVRVEGVDADGAAFTFESDLNETREDFVSLLIGETGVEGIENITLVVDPSGWFGSGAGACLDPSSDRDAIEERIAASIDLEDGDGSGS